MHRTAHFYYMKSNSPFDSDEFKMFSYKVDICPKKRSHDWTLCPFAHNGEKARRRDPVLYNYAPFPCPNGELCENRDACGMAHGAFEYWLHPAKYRTRHCNIPGECDRKVCFFAHNQNELRSEAMRMWYCIYKPYLGLGMDVAEMAIVPGKERSSKTSLVLSEAEIPTPIKRVPPESTTKVIHGVGDGKTGLGLAMVSDNEGVESNKSVGIWDIGLNLDLDSIFGLASTLEVPCSIPVIQVRSL